MYSTACVIELLARPNTNTRRYIENEKLFQAAIKNSSILIPMIHMLCQYSGSSGTVLGIWIVTAIFIWYCDLTLERIYVLIYDTGRSPANGLAARPQKQNFLTAAARNFLHGHLYSRLGLKAI